MCATVLCTIACRCLLKSNARPTANINLHNVLHRPQNVLRCTIFILSLFSMDRSGSSTFLQILLTTAKHPRSSGGCQIAGGFLSPGLVYIPPVHPSLNPSVHPFEKKTRIHKFGKCYLAVIRLQPCVQIVCVFMTSVCSSLNRTRHEGKGPSVIFKY